MISRIAVGLGDDTGWQYDLPYVRRVGVSLHALGLWFEHLSLSPFSQAKELRKFTSIGRMPALVLDNGETLIERAAILDHLDEVVGPSRALRQAAAQSAEIPLGY